VTRGISNDLVFLNGIADTILPGLQTKVDHEGDSHFYRWAQRDNPPTSSRLLEPDPETYARVVTMPTGMKYWEQLAAVLQRERVEDRDRFFMAWLQNLGCHSPKLWPPAI
jgi:hypothetical protein